MKINNNPAGKILGAKLQCANSASTHEERAAKVLSAGQKY
jgi:hypothetical protein